MRKILLLLVIVSSVITTACGNTRSTQPPSTSAQPTPALISTISPTSPSTPTTTHTSPPPLTEDLAAVTYASSDKVLMNPFRGFYYHTEAHSTDYEPLGLSELQGYRAQLNITLILRELFLEDFVDRPISDAYLQKIRADLDVAREAGFGVIMRFAYSTKNTLPYGDAPKAVVLNHIAQLVPIFQDYSDIIKVVQAGFIGAWGEWYYTDHFAHDPAAPDDLSPADYQDRFDVVKALLQASPPDTFVQVRTPSAKLHFFPDEPLNINNAYNASEVARVGFHNDCFLASDDDYGTFQDDAERQYLAAETRFSPMGGETCGLNPPRSSCPTALTELAFYHWSFINVGYQPEVIQSWQNEGCYDHIQQHLGYRFVLQSAQFSQATVPGGRLQLALALKNVGWAGLSFKTQVELVLRNTATQQEYILRVADDPRQWWPSTEDYPLVHTLCIPPEASAGTYALLLRMAPADAKNKALYAIQFGNDLSWEPETGLTNLGYSLEIQEGPVQTDCQAN